MRPCAKARRKLHTKVNFYGVLALRVRPTGHSKLQLKRVFNCEMRRFSIFPDKWQSTTCNHDNCHIYSFTLKNKSPQYSINCEEAAPIVIISVKQAMMIWWSFVTFFRCKPVSCMLFASSYRSIPKVNTARLMSWAAFRIERLRMQNIFTLSLLVKILAMPKPEQHLGDPKSHHPISRLCVPFKISERLIFARVEPTIDPVL